MTKFFQVTPSSDYPIGCIGANAHGLEWRIEMLDDYSGWVVTNNAAQIIDVFHLEDALNVVRENSIG